MSRCALVAVITLVLLILSLKSGAAADPIYTVGIDSNCPYGIVACWPEVRWPLAQIEGVRSVSERPDATAGTCELTAEQGRLISVGVLRRNLAARVGRLFEIRGVEASLDGTLLRETGRPVFRAAGQNETIPLAPLSHKIQIDRNSMVRQSATAEESAAFERLMDAWDGDPMPVRITGPLRLAEKTGDSSSLEVRLFAPLPAVSAR